MINLEELQTAIDKATSGPWRAFECEDWWGVYRTDHAESVMELGSEHGDQHVTELVSEQADAEAIALLRNSAPELIAEVRRLRAAVEAVEKLADRLQTEADDNFPNGWSWKRDAAREFRATLAEHLGTGSES